jgi:hypothetical protein
LDPPAIAQFLGLGNWLISKVRVSRLDRARDAMDLVVATVEAPEGVVEHAIFGEDLVDGRTSTRGVSRHRPCRRISGVGESLMFNETNRHAEAEPLFRRALSINKKSSGPSIRRGQ